MSNASHSSQLVLRLDPGFSPDRFAQVVAEVARANPILCAPIRRSRGIGVPVYQLDRALDPSSIPVAVHELATRPEAGTWPPVFRTSLNGVFDARRGHLLRFDVVTYPDGSADLAMTWLHMLLDGSGSERFIEHLAACSADPNHPREIPLDPSTGGLPTRKDGTTPTAQERGKMAQAWQAHMAGFAAAPPTSLAGPLTRTPQLLDYRLTTLDKDETEAVVARAKKMAGFLTPMLFYLAATIRAHRAVAASRGPLPKSWVVPLPVNVRAKGTEGEVFRTHVSLVWFHVTPSETEDLAGLIDVLKKQRLAAIKEGLIDAGLAAMDYARRAPTRLYASMARRGMKGELCSFFFAYTGAFAPDAQELCGVPITQGFHVPSVPPSPGSSVVTSIRNDQLNVTQIWQEGAVSEEEVEILRQHFLADLLGR